MLQNGRTLQQHKRFVEKRWGLPLRHHSMRVQHGALLRLCEQPMQHVREFVVGAVAPYGRVRMGGSKRMGALMWSNVGRLETYPGTKTKKNPTKCFFQTKIRMYALHLFFFFDAS